MSTSRVLARVVGAAILLVILVAVLLPNNDLAWMRDHWSWFNRPMLWIEHMGGPVNLVHLALFLVFGALARLGWPATRWRQWLGWLLLIGVVTELAQLWIPGRDPRVSDVLVDVVAGLLGWWMTALGCLVARVMVKR